ncbi:hypothetical protein H6G81_02900 [Scytonema hofmannii FACHB-248]|uniref:Uncharacterized protein n=1 Tax=Scytonema hofmannii FACHB-248 TaxID=1842502 RepID=A0ABR8GKD1_9CYAN|nr:MULTISPECIES: hypothetical protein [Nostocales]MBD2603504.1 hypothetical protein [Scytonema hofmannii FACHB-248]
MPSASSNRYQSRLFNFVHRQSRHLGDRLDSTFRHLQVATKWSLQALFYPVVLLVQKALESSDKQLHAQAPQNRLKLQTNNIHSQPDVDTPIQRVLQALEDKETRSQGDKESVNKSFLGFKWFKFFPNKPSASSLNSSSTGHAIPARLAQGESGRNGAPGLFTGDWGLGRVFFKTWLGSESRSKYPVSPVPNPQSPVPFSTVRGIASHLENHNLVLVTAENEILDILTREQQEELQDRIIGEIADYWHYWRLATEKQHTQLLPEIERLLQKLTGNANITPALPEAMQTQALVNAEEVLAFLDASMAKLESNALTPLSSATLQVQQRSLEIIKVVQTQLNIFIYGKELTVRGEDIQSDRLRIQAIIEAAVNYFFGERTGKKLDASPPKSNVFQANQRDRYLPNQDLVADPWLSWDDLFGDFEPIDQETRPTKNQALPGSQSPGYLQNWLNSYQNIPKKPASKLVKRQKPTTDLTRTEKASGKLLNRKSTESKISHVRTSKGELAQKQRSQTTEIEAKPDWIETKATSVEYEKHPLERILAWLDAALLCLEEKFVRLFQLLQQFWLGK